MKNIIIILFCYFIIGGDSIVGGDANSWADSDVTVSTSAADAGVVLAKQQADIIIGDIATQNQDIAILNKEIASATAKINDDNANLAQIQGNLLSLATQAVPVQSAVQVCLSNPASYCPGYTLPAPPLITDPNAVNWTDIAGLHLQGLNWSNIQSIHSEVNWTAIGIVNGNQGINWSGLNWNTAIPCLNQGVNWST